MTDTPVQVKKNKIFKKRPPKGQRTYTRRLKQAARKNASLTHPPMPK